MADKDVKDYMSQPSKPIDARSHKPGPVKPSTEGGWNISHAEFGTVGSK